jgi:hypothetical protein
MELLGDIRDRFSIFVPMVKELLTPEEIEATQMRLTRLIDSGIFPVPSEDWPAIPWPPI